MLGGEAVKVLKKYRFYIVTTVIELIVVAIPILVNAFTKFGSTFSIIWLFTVIAVAFVLVRYQDSHQG